MTRNNKESHASTSTRIEHVLVQLALALWWGGLTFYAGVVVPTGTDLLGSETQGMVTQQVTHWLNGLGWIAMGLLIRRVWSQQNRIVTLSWFTIVASLVVLQLIHRRLDMLLAADSYDDASFYAIHRWYLIGTTLQWFAGLILIGQAGNSGSDRQP